MSRRTGSLPLSQQSDDGGRLSETTWQHEPVSVFRLIVRRIPMFAVHGLVVRLQHSAFIIPWIRMALLWATWIPNQQTGPAVCFCAGLLLLSDDYCSRRCTDTAPVPTMPLERRLAPQWSRGGGGLSLWSCWWLLSALFNVWQVQLFLLDCRIPLHSLVLIGSSIGL